MFTFFIKKPKIVLDCFTYVPELIKLFPIVPARERIPAFWRNIPTTIKHEGASRGTMRTCPGVSTLFTSGFILQSWSDYYVNTENNTVTTIPEGRSETHNAKQWNNSDSLKDFLHVKLVSPWRIKEKTGVNFLYTNCFWHDTSFKPTVVNGIVEYKYQHTTSVNMLVPKSMFPKEFTINAGKELAHILPMSEKEVEIKMHEISKEEYENMHGYDFALNGQYFKRKKLLMSKGL